MSTNPSKSHYLVYVKIIGGDWQPFKMDGRSVIFGELPSALGIAATLKDSIRETMIIMVTQTFEETPDGLVLVGHMEIVE